MAFTKDAIRSIRKPMEVAVDIAGVGHAVDRFAHLLTTAVVRGLMTEQQAEHFVVDYVRSGRSTEEGMQPLLTAIAKTARAWLADRGFPIKARPVKHARVHVSPHEYGLAVWATGYYLVELQGMRQWADRGTRRAVVDAVSGIRGGFWNCCHAADLYGAMSYYGQLMAMAETASRRPKVNFDRLWKVATETCETDEHGLDRNQITLVGVGDRDSFEYWMERQMASFREHRAFLSDAPTGRVDAARCRAVRAWARRAGDLAKEYEKLDPVTFTEPGEFRHFEEQCIVSTARAQLSHVDDYFQQSADWFDEVAGLEFIPNPDTGKGLVEAGIQALAGQAVLGALEGLLK